MEDYWALSMVKINMKKHSTVFAVIRLLSLITIGKIIEILAFTFTIFIKWLIMAIIGTILTFIAIHIITFYPLLAVYFSLLISISLIIWLAFHITTFEVLIVIAIIGILASIAVPNYCDNHYVIRSRIKEGANLIAGAKTIKELKAIATTWNAQANGKGATGKYVKSVLIDPNTGAITITFNATMVHTSEYIPENSTLVFTPYVLISNTKSQQLALALTQGATGKIDWGCASVSNTVSAARQLPTIHIGALPTKYAPSECR